MSARLIQVIETELDMRGEGKPHSPIRRIRQYWSTEGVLLAEVDPCEAEMRKATTDAIHGKYQHELEQLRARIPQAMPAKAERA